MMKIRLNRCKDQCPPVGIELFAGTVKGLDVLHVNLLCVRIQESTAEAGRPGVD